MPPMTALMVNTKTLAHRGISTGAGHVWVDSQREIRELQVTRMKRWHPYDLGLRKLQTFCGCTKVVFSIYLRGYRYLITSKVPSYE